MNFFSRLRASFARFMQGRYGTDQLNFAFLVGAVALTLIGSLTGLRLLIIAADALLVLVLFRMFSRDLGRRAAENQKYLLRTYRVRTAFSQWVSRLKNRRKYRYFTCPKCHERLRVPRGKGNVTITCRKCGAKFDRKA